MIKKAYMLAREVGMKLLFSGMSMLGIAFVSRFVRRVRFKRLVNQPCFIIGNGPSLTDDLPLVTDLLKRSATFCVNDFCFTEHFDVLKPAHYVVIDPIYWTTDITEEAAKSRDGVYNGLIAKTTWPLQLYIPVEAKRSGIHDNYSFKENRNITITYFNRTAIDSVALGSHFLYRQGLGMPKPHNVLVAAIFLAINRGYSPIYILGADHSWHEGLHVGNDNILYVKQDRFYGVEYNPMFRVQGNAGEKPEIFKMHEIFNIWSKVYAAYHQLDLYARSTGVSVLNISRKSYIDAFERKSANDIVDKKIIPVENKTNVSIS